MTDSVNCCPPPLNVQDFLFKEESVGKICDEFQYIPTASSIIAADGKRGLLYIGHEKKLIVVRPGPGSIPEWRLELDLPLTACRVEINCDYTYLAVTLNEPMAIIYDAGSIMKHKLDKLYDIRLSSSAGHITVSDLKWNPAIPEVLCSVTSDHTVGCFQVNKDKGIHIIGKEKPSNLEAMCVSWSPKGKQLVIGCKNGDIVQLKPELKVARHLTGPNPSEGAIVSILWISNYQFCACYYHDGEERVTVMIVDAPKGVTVPKFTNYEDITYGGGPRDNLYYYFEYIAEWGIIVAASTHSSELAVLGTADNGATWNLWQLVEGGTGQLPLNRKKGTENYPVGIAVDKTSVQKLPWGPDSTLPNPVPILRIIVTSGQMCCYHMVNLKNEAPVICSPPTQIVSAPVLSTPSLGPAEVSFNLPSGATSTPQKSLVSPQVPQPDRIKLTNTTNTFAEAPSFSFSGLGFKLTPEHGQMTNQPKNIGFAAPTETKITTQVDAKNNFMQQPSTTNKQQQPMFAPPPPPIQQGKPAVLPSAKQSSPNTEGKISSIPPASAQTELKLPKESAKEESHSISPSKQTAPVYDDEICLQAFREEQSLFETELKAKLEMPSWSCGTDEERQLLVKRTNEMEEFFKELQDTTTSLETDVSYLKSLLLQSFAWLEESKSKRCTNTNNLTGPSRNESNKLAELERLYYFTQMQLTQTTKALDLEWDDCKNHELSKMKLPTTEMILKSLMKQNQIIAQEKATIEELTKKWRKITRGGGSTLDGLTVLDRSMASLKLSHQTSNTTLNDSAMDLRCKFITAASRKFSRVKQAKLRDLLAVTEPKVISAVKPTAVQDRLQATLSSLALSKDIQLPPNSKQGKTFVEAQQMSKSNHTRTSPADGVAIKTTTPTTTSMMRGTKSTTNPLSSLDNLVTGLGGTGNAPNILNKSPSATMSFAATLPGSQQKSESSFSPGPMNYLQCQQQQQPSHSVISRPFNIASNDTQVSSQTKAPASDTNFPSFSFSKVGAETHLQVTTSATAMSTSAAPIFNFSVSTTAANFASLIPKVDSVPSGVEFSMGLNSTVSQSTGLNLSKPFTAPAEPPKLSLSSTATSSSSNQVDTSQSASGQAIGQQLSSFGKTATSSPSSLALSQSPSSSTAATSAQGSSTSTVTTTLPTFSSSGGSSATLGSVSIMTLPNSSHQQSTASPTKPAEADTLTTLSSAPNLAGLLGATASLNFGSMVTSSTASSGSPTIGNIFGNYKSAAKNDVSSASTVSTPLSSGVVTATANATSILGDFNKLATPATLEVKSQLAVGSSNSNDNGNIFFSSKPTTTATPATTTHSSSIFGTHSSTLSPSLFGGRTATAATTTTTQSSSVFGSSATTQAGSGASLFGGSTTTTSSSGTCVFGTSIVTPSSSGSLFGSSQVTPSTVGSVFGSSLTPSTSGGSIFGSNTTQSPSIFGGTTAAQNTSVFGAVATAASPFGTKAATTVTTTAVSPVFGGSSAATSSPFTAMSSTLTFGTSAATPKSSVFGGTATIGSSLFGSSAAPTTTTSIFGSSTATNVPSPFGAPVSATSATSIFGSPTTTATASGSIFGGAASPQSVFGGTAPSGGSIFGGPPALSGGTSMFGGTASSGTIFGQPTTFGSKSTFGTTTTGFGSSAGFGAPPAFGATPNTGFGSPSTFGATSAVGSTSPNKVFGSSTFEALGSQSDGLSFGSLAQKTTEQQKPQAFQGSSSFSSWR
ncbi:nuclear pore complex protein Nup214 [Copidosoma floridanum]|uniref:nuclear pore complex protein Nup214 n=1 Tax=Copidosoma floridanum TaxID=29053 RepID=UPI0006C97938|nr:nuclear pore complex protein Nup214 [Copidosoma floridanum]